MPASPKPPRTPPKPKRPIRRKTPLKSGSAQALRRTRVRPMSDRKRAEVQQRRDVTRPVVLRRDGQRCRACGWGASSLWAADTRWLEVHEEPPRSLGGDPTNPADCITLCCLYTGEGCHQRRTRGALKIVKGPDGCNGPVTFTEKDRTWTG